MSYATLNGLCIILTLIACKFRKQLCLSRRLTFSVVLHANLNVLRFFIANLTVQVSTWIFLNNKYKKLCQDEINALMYWGIMLKNNDIFSEIIQPHFHVVI